MAHKPYSLSLRQRIMHLKRQIDQEADPLRRLHLIQHRLNAEDELRREVTHG